MLNYKYSGAKLLKSYPAFKRTLTWQIMSASQHEQNKGILPTHFLCFKYYPLNRIFIHATPLPSPLLPYTTHYHCIITVSKQAISRVFAIFLICVPQSFFLKSEVMEEPSALGSTDTNSNCSKPTEALDTACVYT